MDRQFVNEVFAAIRSNKVAAIILQVFAGTIALIYFTMPALTPVFTFVSNWSQVGGATFAALSTALFGGIIPLVVSELVKRDFNWPALFSKVLYLAAVWGGIGTLVFYFYQWQSIWFGDELTLFTLLKKVAVDQFVFSALLTCPLLTLAYRWLAFGFRLSNGYAHVTDNFAREVISTVMTNWVIWIPCVVIIYSFPLPLQLPLFNLVLCFFSLVLLRLKE